MGFQGFPRRVHSIPVPAPFFGPLLEEIDDLDEFKCTMRLVWLLQQKKGFPRFVTLKEVFADRVLASALSIEGRPDQARVEAALSRAVGRGTLTSTTVEQAGEKQPAYALNTESDREALANISTSVQLGRNQSREPWEAATELPNVFALYESNIGMLSPMIADELREAEDLYPVAWIEDAFREAVSQNKRSWRYISRILERWDQEGKHDGKSGRYLKKTRNY
ncbi:MAG: DnaD domain protein [Chloroflexi bacterium]|nr:DnaD domain protein [Chloroflexota bacterium]